MGQSVDLYARDAKTGELSLKFVQRTPHAMDNAVIRATAGDSFEILMGAIPDTYSFVMSTLLKDHRPIPGGVTVARKISWALGFEDVVIHDGSLLSTVSVAARWKQSMLLGGPKTPGVLICPAA
jgi:hypothetical protein